MTTQKNLTVISLNLWAGKQFEPINRFIEGQARETDIFCFQEVYSSPVGYVEHERGARNNMYEEIQALLPDFQGLFFPAHTDIAEPHIHAPAAFGLAVFVRRNVDVLSFGSQLVYGTPMLFVPGTLETFPRNLAYVTVMANRRAYTVFNFHGLWNGEGKTDTPARIIQSNVVRKLYDDVQGRNLFCGDFNLRPDTKSFKILADGLQDLVAINGITNTRSETLYLKEERHANYVLASPNLEVISFEVVPEHDVSDHLPLKVVVR